ncbi:hypothetical protein, partial [Nocardioides sp.]|uniref:hypothetical protein n=1 Tax=Nocardioides sp. TaxID=35761 RepID=UPI0027349BBD
LSVYTRGAVIVERMLNTVDFPKLEPHTRASANQHIDVERFPNTHAAALTHSFTGVSDDEFDRGLRNFINGIRLTQGT